MNKLWELSYQCLLDLASEEGINASARNEAYGCIFGRDSAITILKILRAHKKMPMNELLGVCRRTLLTLVQLQGKEINIESGEEPGKFIHEFRRDNYERLINREKPWFVYPDGILRNYDSIDATALVLIALYRYWQITGDKTFLMEVLSSVEAGLNWIISFGDKDKDLLIEYALPQERRHGGLGVHSWADSHESLVTIDGHLPAYPIAPVEVQAFAWLAMKLWSDFYLKTYPRFGKKLSAQAAALKKRFGETFLFEQGDTIFAAQALDGEKKQIQTITANPLLLLWASYQKEGVQKTIVEKDLIGRFVDRAFAPDLFDKDAGIRTMSTTSPTFDSTVASYHNGSFWPMLNGLIHEGLEMWGFSQHAARLKEASLKPLAYFNSPIELYIKAEDGSYLEYRSRRGKLGCRYQAWSAAAALDWLT